MNVINMLNTKYIIAEEEGQVFPYVNDDANGNAWFVEEIENKQTANAEILALDSLNTKIKAITTEDRLSSKQFQVDSIASISLKDYKPNYLKYKSVNPNDGFAVFSEMYYSHGWNASIDGTEVPIYRVNYALRGLEIPAGTHEIVFKFEPEVVKTGGTIALASSIIFGILLLGALFMELKRQRE